MEGVAMLMRRGSAPPPHVSMPSVLQCPRTRCNIGPARSRPPVDLNPQLQFFLEGLDAETNRSRARPLRPLRNLDTSNCAAAASRSRDGPRYGVLRRARDAARRADRAAAACNGHRRITIACAITSIAQLSALGLQPQLQTATAIGTRYREAGRVQNIVARLPGTEPGSKAVLDHGALRWRRSRSGGRRRRRWCSRDSRDAPRLARAQAAAAPRRHRADHRR